MFEKIQYHELNSRQQENFNFQKFAARLADYGYNSMRLSDDFLGADFIALHIDGSKLLRVQLKGRLSFNTKYYGKGIHIAFREDDRFYIYPHDELRQRLKLEGFVANSKSDNWVLHGSRTWPRIPKNMIELMKEYEV